jgi:hypothetical protein
MSYIRNAKVTRKEEEAWCDVAPWTWACIRQDYLEQSKTTIHGMLGYVGPSYGWSSMRNSGRLHE